MTERPILSKHEIVTGKKEAGRILYSFPAGSAFAEADCSYYTLRLWMLYGMSYYLVRTRDDDTRYTVFSKKVENEDGVKFQNPVGAGWISSDLKTHLEITFRFPRQSIYMSLFPDR